MRSATRPAPTPKTRCLNATEETLEAPRARGPKIAEAKMRTPTHTRSPIKIMSDLSIRPAHLNILEYYPVRTYLRCGKRQNNSGKREYYRQHPVAHNDLRSG